MAGITTTELAKLCGVSRGTMDRVVNGRPGVNSETKRSVMKIAVQHHYNIDYNAGFQHHNRTHIIGLVLPDLHNRFFSQLADEFTKEARRNGYFVYLMLANKMKNWKWSI